MMVAVLLPLLLLLLPPLRDSSQSTIPRVHGGGACTTDEDCQLNGRCRARRCACLAAWEGANCSLLATRETAGAAHALANLSSWGGRSLRYEKDGLFHGFFSEFSNSCGMDTWDNNSRIVHMTSSTPSPSGPGGYTRHEVAIPSFSHCVDTVRLADGRWLMFHNGDGAPRAGCGGGSPDCPRHPDGQWLADCTASGNGTTPHDPVPASPAPEAPPGFQRSNGVHIADSPWGPWLAPNASDLRGFPACDCPAVASLANGSLLYMCQPIVNEYPWYPTPAQPHHAVASMYIVERWGDPWVEKNTSLDVPGWIKALGDVKLDDPTLWQDSHGFFHILSHNGDGPHPCGAHGAAGLAFRDGNELPVGCSAHLYSRDALRWTMSPVAAHNASVALKGGGHRELYRQRPKVLVDRGEIVALFGGVMPCGEARIRGGAWHNGRPTSERLAECTSDHPPKNPTGVLPRGGEQRGMGRNNGDLRDTEPKITSDRGQDNCWTSVVPLATRADRDTGHN